MQGNVRREGNFLIGEGKAGLQMYDDTMNLALSKTIKTTSFVRTSILSLSTLVAGFGAYQLDSKTLSAVAGALGVFAIQQGISALKERKQYNEYLDEAVSHGYSTREELKKIDYRWL